MVKYLCVLLANKRKWLMINYKPLWRMMKNSNTSKTELRIAAHLSTSTFAKLSKNEKVSLDVLVRLCSVLKCQLSDICYIEYE